MLDRRIKLIIGNTLSKLEIPKELVYYFEPMLNEIDQELSFDVIGREHTQMFNRFDSNGQRMWDGKKHLINLTGIPLKKISWKRYITDPWMFLTGNAPRIVRIMAKYNVLPVIEHMDSYSIPEENKISLTWNEDFVIRDYQQRCVDSAVKNRRGILQIATGGGKTVIASKIIQELGIKPVIFLVTTKDLLYQAQSSFEKTLNMEGGIGIIGDGKCEIKEINVSTIQTIMKCLGKSDEFSKEVKSISEWLDGGFGEEAEISAESISSVVDLLGKVKLLFFDECQHAPADTCRNVLFECINATYKFGLSATPFREDGEDLTIEGLFGENLISISSSFLIENGFLVKPSILMWNMKYKRPSKSYQTEYKEDIVENLERNKWIANWSRYFSEQDKTVLVLVKQTKHGNILKDLIPNSEFIDGKKTSKKRNQAIEDLRNKDLKILIATTLADEGLDIPSLDVLILAGSGKSKTKALQRIGRVIRSAPGKDSAIVVDFIDQTKYCKKHSLTRKKIYNSEEAFKIQVIDEEFLADNAPKTLSKMIEFEKEFKSSII